MAHTNAWSDAIPLGSELASHIDDQIRQLRLDVHERMNDFVVDWTADPVVIKPSIVASTDVKRYIDGLMFKNTSGARLDASMSASLPFKIKITKVEGWIIRTSGNVDMEIKSVPFGAGSYVETSEQIVTTSAGAEQILDFGALTFNTDGTLDPAKQYFIRFDTTGVYTLLGTRFTFVWV